MKHLLLTSFLLLSIYSFAQVAISDQGGPAIPDSTSILDLQTNSKGFLPPRLTESEKNSIQNPAEGLIIFNTTTGCIEINLALQGWSDIYCDCANPPSAAFTAPGPITQYSSASFSANSPGLTYNWSFQGGSPSSSNVQNPSVTWSSPGSYLVSLVVSDGLGCSDSTGMMVTVDPCTPPSSVFTNPGTGSINVAANFSANTAGQNYAWIFQSGSPATSTNQSPSVTWTAAGTYNVQLIVSDANGCADTSTGTITIQTCVTGGSQTFSYTGSAVDFIAPNACGAITIEAWGAQGGNTNSGSGGLGARMRGDFTTITPGETLKVVVGQQGNFEPVSSGGGGGSGVVRSNGSPLVIAGAGAGLNGSSNPSNIHGTTSTSGQDGAGFFGSGGSGGSDGTGTVYSGSNFSWGGRGFNSGNFGSTGQNGISTSTTTTNGTFGLGGGGGSVGPGQCNCGGGGGGYSGGGSGAINNSGGGGGSINNGTNQSNTGATRSGNGQVIISW